MENRIVKVLKMELLSRALEVNVMDRFTNKDLKGRYGNRKN